MSPSLKRTAYALGIVGCALIAACAPPPPTVPTIQAAATVVAPTVSAAQTSVAPTVSAAQTSVPSTVSAAQTSVAPTVQAGATAAAPTVQAAQAALRGTATAIAPTAQAVATHVAPTVQAAATQAVVSVATSVASSTVQITGVQVDQTDTRIMIRNSGTGSVNLRNWTLLIGPQVAVTLGDLKIDANQTRTLHLTAGDDTDTDVFLGLGSGVVSATFNPGDQVVLVSSGADVASIYSPL